MARLYPLFSGSQGNSYFVGAKNAGVLIDAGKNCKQICVKLEQNQIDISAIKAILISHEHSDHIGALRVLASKYKIPTFCSQGTARNLIVEKVANGQFPLHILEDDLQIAGMTIKKFATMHDSEESIGFRIKTADDKIISYATDLGKVTDEVRDNLEGSDFCIIESNHDIAMLQAGSYPYSLKRRILSDFGHLSNTDCAETIKKLYKAGTRKFMLAHISSDNNTPELALQTSVSAMQMQGLVYKTDFDIICAPKENLIGEMVIF